MIAFGRPDIGRDEVAAVTEVLESGWLTTGSKTAAFERAACDLVGRGVVAVSSCSAALHLAMLAHGIGPGDEVITSVYTFAATVNAICHVGARPVLVDVHRSSGLMSEVDAAALVTTRTRAIVPVHYGGNTVDMGWLCQELGDKVVFIEDAAHAVGSKYADGRSVGSDARFTTTFSFYPNKVVTSGEGGWVVGSSEVLRSVRLWSNNGLSKSAIDRYGPSNRAHYDVVVPGFKYAMPDLCAAVGLVQLARLHEVIARRRHIANVYSRSLEHHDLTDLVSGPELSDGWNGGLYPIWLRLDALRADRDRVLAELGDAGVGATVQFIPVCDFSFAKSFSDATAFPIARELSQCNLCLPISASLTDDEVSRVVEVLAATLKRLRR